MVIDFRKLNENSVGDSYPLPNIQDILDKKGEARYFTALDCASGYRGRRHYEYKIECLLD
jgi:hypothetical protein